MHARREQNEREDEGRYSNSGHPRLVNCACRRLKGLATRVYELGFRVWAHGAFGMEEVATGVLAILSIAAFHWRMQIKTRRPEGTPREVCASNRRVYVITLRAERTVRPPQTAAPHLKNTSSTSSSSSNSNITVICTNQSRSYHGSSSIS